MNKVVIIQARMTSTRLPGKVLMKVEGRPLLHHQIARLRRAENVDRIAVATTVNDSDQPVADLCRDLGVMVFRGAEKDVLRRYYEAALEFQADVVVRITADCPLLDPAVADRVIRYFLTHPEADYASNVLQRTYPRGLDTEVLSFSALERCHLQAVRPEDREHVTLYIRNNPGLFKTVNVAQSRDLSHLRWTVDTADDFRFISRVFELLYPSQPEFGMEDVVRLLERHPDLAGINAHVQQKPV